MAYIIETPNPFEPLTSVKYTVPAGTRIVDWVHGRFPNLKEFPCPTLCVVNGDALMRKDWDREIKDDDIINFVALPGGYSLILAIIVVVIVIAFTLYFTLNQPKVPGETPGSDPVFSTKGQQNAIRLGEPIEVCYGRNRIFPSYASRPYFEYRNNEQYQFGLFSLGQGEYEVSAVQIGDTPIANFQEVQYEILPPGSPVTLFPSAVYTATEVGNQRMFAPNEPEYVAPGWIGPFPANPAGTQAKTIAMDFILPKGLYRMTKAGRPDIAGANIEVQLRLIDDLGAPLGGWVDFTGVTPIAITGATVTPQRKTYSQDVALGRYEARVRRTSIAGLSSNFGDEVQWEGLRSYLDLDQDFGNVTILAVIIRATNNLNDRTQAQFNVIATRKLPVRESGGSFTTMTTRSIVWAFADVFRASYGGRLDDKFIDWDALEALDALYTARGEYFDWVLRDPITVWEAARTIARVGRATPLLAGSLVTMKRDGPLEVPVALFNQENILQGSFVRNTKLWDLDEYDSIRVEYTEVSTGYKQEQVTCILPGGTSNHPEDIRFPGIQDRAHAYHEGLYMLASRRYLRENAEFVTGLEGYIPTFGDLIAVVHDVPKWGQGGFVVHAERVDDTHYQIWVSEPLRWTEGQVHQIVLRGRTANVVGPFTANRTDSDKQVNIRSDSDIDFLLGGKNEPMLFQFGLSNNVTKRLRAVSVEPQGNEAIKITGVNDAPIIHTFDDLVPAPLATNALAPVVPGLPVINSLTITQVDAAISLVQIAWSAAFGTKYYVVQTSQDNVNWSDTITTSNTFIQLQVFPGPLYVRVASVNDGQGPWKTGDVSIAFLIELTLATPWVALEWRIEWMMVLLATEYEVKVYDNSESAPILKRTETTLRRNYTYHFDPEAIEDANVVRDMLVTVKPIFEDDDTADVTELELHNDIPSPPTSLAVANVGIDSDGDEVNYHFTWTVPHEDDLHRIKLWVSTVNGFDPSVVVPVLDETISTIGWATIPTGAYHAIALDSTHHHVAHYWRIAVFDVWGNEISTNVSAQGTIPAYP